MTNREDGPKLQKLFAAIDGPNRFKQVVPASIAGMVGSSRTPAAPAAPDALGNAALAAVSGNNVHSIPGAPDAVDASEVLPDVRATTVTERVEGEGQEDVVDFGVINYPKALHESGEAAIQIVKNMVDSEFAMGNPSNIPEPIMGWYLMTLVYQLCVLEAVNAPYDARKEHYMQIDAAWKAFNRYTGAYADSVLEDVQHALANRYRPEEIIDEDRAYGIAKAPLRGR